MMVSMGYGSSPLGDSWILQLGTTPTWFPLDSPLTPPAPTFVAPVTGIPATLAVGQTFQMTCSVKNYGGSSDIGRIVDSFPSFSVPSDGQWVTTGTSNDTPGYTKQPAGSTLLDIDCQSMPSGHLVVEYDDNVWLGYGNEQNNLTLTVQPRTPGTFYVDIRATMHEPGAAACPGLSALPGGGVTTVDQQGYPVSRFAIQVTPPPPPAPAITVGSLPASVYIGQDLNVSVAAWNNGGPSDDGDIVVSFPNLINPTDGQWVS